MENIKNKYITKISFVSSTPSESTRAKARDVADTMRYYNFVNTVINMPNAERYYDIVSVDSAEEHRTDGVTLVYRAQNGWVHPISDREAGYLAVDTTVAYEIRPDILETLRLGEYCLVPDEAIISRIVG